MDRVKYSHSKLLAASLFGALIAGFFGWLLANPGAARFGLWGLLFGSALGRFVLTPAFMLFGIMVMWRTGAALASDGVALELAEGGVKLNTLWRRVRLRWSEVGSIDVERVRFRFLSARTLVFLRNDGSRVRLPIGLSELSNAGVGRLLIKLDSAREAGRASAEGALSLSKRAAPPADGAEERFDADAAIARYLARKAAEPESAAPPEETVPVRAPLRPAFGRKGVHG
jgi:hypothetical protein